MVKIIVDSTSAGDDGLGMMVADSAAVVTMFDADSSAGVESIGVDVSISGGPGELDGVDNSGISDEGPLDEVSGPSDVESKLALLASSAICSVLVLNDSSSAVLEELKVELFTSDESSALDGVAGGSKISDEVTSEDGVVSEEGVVSEDEVTSGAIVVSSGVDPKLVLVTSSGLCSVLTLDGSPAEMLLVLVISPDRTGSSDEAASEDASSLMLLLLSPSELETTSLFALSSGDVS